jgi:adenylate cyclase
MEIERKFLIASDGWRTQVSASYRIEQGYLVSTPERTVRVRLARDAGLLTIKGARSASGLSRYEWECALAPADVEALFALCEPGRVEKTRHLVQARAHTFEVDEFHGENAGLIVAEIELDAEDEQFERPPWLGVEVTGDERYQNALLRRRPYSTW